MLCQKNLCITFDFSSFRVTHYEHLESDKYTRLHPYGTDRFQRDSAGTLCGVSPNIHGHCAVEHRHDADYLSRCPAAHSDVFLPHPSVIC